MSEEQRLKEIIAQGRGADEWLNHPQFRHAITLMKAEYIRAFEATKFKDNEERDEIWRKLQALNGIVNRMERMIRDGDKANQTLLEKARALLKRNNP